MAQQPPQDVDISIAHSHILSNKHFLIWRCIAFIYILFVAIASNIVYTIEVNQYLTLWTVYLATFYMALSLYSTYLYHTNAHKKCISYCKYSSIFQILASSFSITIVIAYWALFWKDANYSDPFNPQIHGTTAIITIIDYYLCYNTVSFKSSFLFIIIFGVLYSIWSVIWVLLLFPNKPIYGDILDWKHNIIGPFIICIIIILLAVIVHAFLCWTNSKLISKRLKGINIENDDRISDINNKNVNGIEKVLNIEIEMGTNLSTGSVHVADNSADDESQSGEIP